MDEISLRGKNPDDSNNVGKVVRRFLETEKKNSPILLWAVVVGALTGFVGGVFQIALAKFADMKEALMGLLSGVPVLPLIASIAISAVMVYLALLLVRKIAPETGGSGVQEMEGALDEVRPVRWKRVLPVKFIAGLLSLGSGMVMGREGPTIQMGGNLGKMVSDFTKLEKDDTHTLIASGAGWRA